jgi:hypothetical protein
MQSFGVLKQVGLGVKRLTNQTSLILTSRKLSHPEVGTYAIKNSFSVKIITGEVSIRPKNTCSVSLPIVFVLPNGYNVLVQPVPGLYLARAGFCICSICRRRKDAPSVLTSEKATWREKIRLKCKWRSIRGLKSIIFYIADIILRP